MVGVVVLAEIAVIHLGKGGLKIGLGSREGYNELEGGINIVGQRKIEEMPAPLGSHRIFPHSLTEFLKRASCE